MSRWSNRRRKFREILAAQHCVYPASVYDPISARIAENIGYEMGMYAGSLAALAVLAAPDLILLTQTEFAQQAHRMGRASELPLFADADHGYGNALNVKRTVEELEFAGLAGLAIEDTDLPQPFGQDGKASLLSIEEGVGKMRAAIEGRSDPDLVIAGRTSAAAMTSMASQVRAMLAFHGSGVPTLDYGNNIRQMAKNMGVENAFDFPGFVPAYIRPLFCRGIGPFRWVALSGDPEDIYRTDAKVKELMPDDSHLHNWLDMARERIQFQGLPSRICWVGLGDRHRLGLAFNEMVASGELSAPIVIGRDHLDSGSVASPNRETEAMKDGSDAVSDWPLLNALVNCASGATWVSIHHGGGVGMGYSQHAGMVIVCDGTEDAARRIERVLWNDPATGVVRHADAGYDSAIDCAREFGLNMPSL